VTELELRILSGMHAGARAPLQDGPYLLGTGPDCDFVLADDGVQPRHARLSPAEGGWQMDWLGAEGREPVLGALRLQPGVAVAMGPVVLAIDEARAPWPTLEALVLVPHAPALEPSLPPPADAAAPGPGCRRHRRGLKVLATAAAACAGVSAMAYVAWPLSGTRPGAGAAAHAAAAPGAAASVATTAVLRGGADIEQVLHTLHLAQRALVEPRGQGWRVRALVLSDAEGEALSAALGKLQLPPALQLSTEAELRAQLGEILQQLDPGSRGQVELQLQPGGLRVEGRMKSAELRDKLLAELASAFPQVRTWDRALRTPEEEGAQLMAELRDAGRWELDGHWQRGTLVMDVHLSPEDQPAWEKVLLEATRRHGLPFSAQLHLALPEGAAVHAAGPSALRAPTPGLLPFNVLGVVGGDVPYLLLPDGVKLARGGVLQGWRFAALSEQQIVFENGARRAVLQR
jgi:type III secretion protein D